ncbi:MAG: prephenate dehydrogenase/arogenate dehydrogenase family protein [Dehalococcoidia bacterium]|nr:prephenate dehydrogenase/arogenate dehydrogenase family protein [Dehalococcoidia bacterium]
MQVAIIGLGLIGGSIGLALKQTSDPGWKIVGYARRPEVASQALSSSIVDKIEASLKETVKDAELVIIATPVLTIKGILSQIADHLPHGCVVTDTASTKLQVMKWAEELLPPTVDFIGGHPMAGKETYGIETAEAGLFQGCIYCLTPAEKASPSSIGQMSDMVKKLGATPFFIDTQEHDSLVAGISHLPMLLSAALVSATAKDASWDKMSALAASGYRDLTRLASGNPEVNAHICLSNQEAILHWADKFSKELNRYRRLLASGDKQLEEALAEASKARQQWLKDYLAYHPEPKL